MKATPLSIPDVVLLQPAVHGDSRGFFLEVFHEEKLRAAGIDVRFRQENHSRSRRGVLRGLHYQSPQSQGKLVRVAAGRVFDVAVDLRKSSKHFGRWAAATLSDEEHNMLWIPPGFAHGFYVLSDSADFVYLCTELYAPQHEHCLRWDDPELAIAWPLAEGGPPEISPKDREGKPLREAEIFP